MICYVSPQDVSFTMPYTSLNPALKINTLLNLPLSETGIVNIDTQSLNIDEPIDTDTLQLLHILLVTWLISLYYEGEDKKEKKTDNKATLWIPFHIGGLQQMFVDGSPSISAGIVNKGEILLRCVSVCVSVFVCVSGLCVLYYTNEICNVDFDSSQSFYRD